MNDGADSDDDRADELTAHYRAASAADPDRPSESLRQSIIAHARTVAVDQATAATAAARARRPAATDSGWRITAAASVLVACFAAVLAWHFHAPAPLPAQESIPAPSPSAAHDQTAAGSTVSSQPQGLLPADRRANHLEPPGGSVASSPQAPARVAGTTAAKSAAAGDSTGGPEKALATTQVAPSAAAAPPSVEARLSPEPSAAASARARAARNAPLVTAAESGNLERVDQLLRSGMSTEQTDARGRTALLVATLRGDVPMVERLLAAGARADVVDEDGDTPLATAQRQGPPELARLLERATHP